jgi:chemotaxis signal transduction protein
MDDREHARALIEAIHADASEPDDGATPLLVFEVAGTELAVDASEVEAVTRAAHIAPVPFGPPAVLGIASVRGRMRIVLDAGGARPETAAFLLVLHGDGQLALLADRVTGVRRVPLGDAPPCPLVDLDALLTP